MQEMHGLNAATGNYIMFLDPDDIFESNAVENMYNEISTKKADFITGNYVNMSENGQKWDRPVFSLEKYKPFKLSIDDYINTFFVMNSSVCNKIFNKSFIDKLNLRFEYGLPAEDAIFTMSSFLNASNVYYSSCIVFYYRQREKGSISSNCDAKYFNGINKAYKIIYSKFKEHNKLGYYRYFYSKSMNYIIYKFIDSPLLIDEERKNILKEMFWFFNITKELEIPPCQEVTQELIKSILSEEYDTSIKYCKMLKKLREMMSEQEKLEMSKPRQEVYNKISKLDYKYK